MNECGAEGGSRTRTSVMPTAPWTQRVCQFRHFGTVFISLEYDSMGKRPCQHPEKFSVYLCLTYIENCSKFTIRLFYTQTIFLPGGISFRTFGSWWSRRSKSLSPWKNIDSHRSCIGPIIKNPRNILVVIPVVTIDIPNIPGYNRIWHKISLNSIIVKK